MLPHRHQRGSQKELRESDAATKEWGGILGRVRPLARFSYAGGKQRKSRKPAPLP